MAFKASWKAMNGITGGVPSISTLTESFNQPTNYPGIVEDPLYFAIFYKATYDRQLCSHYLKPCRNLKNGHELVGYIVSVPAALTEEEIAADAMKKTSFNVQRSPCEFVSVLRRPINTSTIGITVSTISIDVLLLYSTSYPNINTTSALLF